LKNFLQTFKIEENNVIKIYNNDFIKDKKTIFKSLNA